MPTPASIGQRFTQLIQHLGLSKNAFAQSLDKTATVIQHLVDERNKPGYDLLCKVFETYPNVSKDWLLMGEGTMLLDSDAPALPAQEAPAAPSASAFEPIDLAELARPPRRHVAGPASLLQPADVAATVALAAAQAVHAPEPAGVSATAPPVPSFSAPVAALPPPPAATLPAALPPSLAATPPAPHVALPPSPDPAYLTAALQTQYLQHQLALAEQRNQHLLEQQALMQQLVAVLQRAI
ncbi:hypothetical protein A0257_03715 [Hymenobacter psoromatis]|nr:hypothetical protein A0257_03715 [Hymenobacter psoromatis]